MHNNLKRHNHAQWYEITLRKVWILRLFIVFNRNVKDIKKREKINFKRINSYKKNKKNNSVGEEIHHHAHKSLEPNILNRGNQTMFFNWRKVYGRNKVKNINKEMKN